MCHGHTHHDGLHDLSRVIELTQRNSPRLFHNSMSFAVTEQNCSMLPILLAKKERISYNHHHHRHGTVVTLRSKPGSKSARHTCALPRHLLLTHSDAL